MSGPDTLHEPRSTDGFLIDQVAELGNIDTGSPCRWRGKREPLTHDDRYLSLFSVRAGGPYPDKTTSTKLLQRRRASWMPALRDAVSVALLGEKGSRTGSESKRID